MGKFRIKPCESISAMLLVCIIQLGHEGRPLMSLSTGVPSPLPSTVMFDRNLELRGGTAKVIKTIDCVKKRLGKGGDLPKTCQDIILWRHTSTYFGKRLRTIFEKENQGQGNIFAISKDYGMVSAFIAIVHFGTGTQKHCKEKVTISLNSYLRKLIRV